MIMSLISRTFHFRFVWLSTAPGVCSMSCAEGSSPHETMRFVGSCWPTAILFLSSLYQTSDTRTTKHCFRTKIENTITIYVIIQTATPAYYNIVTCSTVLSDQPTGDFLLLETNLFLHFVSYFIFLSSPCPTRRDFSAITSFIVL